MGAAGCIFFPQSSFKSAFFGPNFVQKRHFFELAATMEVIFRRFGGSLGRSERVIAWRRGHPPNLSDV